MNISDLKKLKKERGYTAKMISEKADVSISTLQKIFSGETKNPRYETVQKIKSVLYDYDFNHGADSQVGEEAFAYEGNYTLEDYDRIPDDVRVEIIDGVAYDMNTPSVKHQMIIGELHLMFRNIVDNCDDRNCHVLLSPVDVKLDEDNRTVVQPDLIILCHTPHNDLMIEGAPDLAVEVLSKSTRRKDMVIKLNKYMQTGVREYWIVDPYNEKVTVYFFEKEDYPDTYTFDDVIPLGISEGQSIDFAKIKAALW